ncbi:hypothetical protein R6Q59_024051 [Mikania micrantha]
MKTTDSTVKKHQGVRDIRTGKTFTSICWPPTNKLKTIPIPQRFPDRCLSKFVMILDKNDLLRFGEHDIKILVMHQIKTDPVFEVHGCDSSAPDGVQEPPVTNFK